MSSNVTLKEIAKALGISAMTVSRALNNRSNVNEKTRRRVHEKAKSMGYTPNHVAKSLVSRKTRTIGVVIPEISHDFFAKVISGIEEITYLQDYQLILTNSAESHVREIKAIETLWSQRVDGILISCSESTKDYSYFKKVIDSGIPMVFFDRCVDGLGVSTVRVSDRVGAMGVTRHMVSHGYTKFAYLRGSDMNVGKVRYAGFLDVMNEHGISVNEKWVIESGFRERGGYEAMKILLALPPEERPEVVVAVNDPVAIGAVEAIEEAGLSIPGDLAICGFTDDIRAPLLRPPLTTVHQPGELMGKKAAEKLIRTIENAEEPVENIELATTLKIRSSCGCT